MIKCSELRRRICYDAKRGKFWLRNGVSGHAAGYPLGLVRKDGYVYIKLSGYEYLAHRLAWMYIKGYFPENEIDHINRVKNDNRFKNLREVSKSCNVRNQPIREDNASGITGISWSKRDHKWYAYIFNGSKLVNLGKHETRIDAACVRLAAEQCLDWPGCNSSSPAYRYVKSKIKPRGWGE